MRAGKSNFIAYSPLSKIGSIPRSTNILDLIKKNKEEEKKEKILKILTVLGFVGTMLLLGIFFF